MLGLIYLVSCHSGYTCGHSLLRGHTPPIQFQKAKTSRSAMESEEWEPIRIFINYSQLHDEYDDIYKCTNDKVGTNITWGSFNVSCTKDLVLTENKIKAAEETLENVRKYFESMLKVRRIKGEYKHLTPPNDFGIFPNITYSGIDLYISIFPRIFPPGYTVIASAGTVTIDDSDNRPSQGYVTIGVDTIPDEVQSSETADQSVFSIYIHEILHIIAMDDLLYPFFHSTENNEPYGDKYLSQIEIGGINRTIFNAPYSHNFAVKHYGVETFKSGNQEVRSGILLEDEGGPMTAIAHLDQLYYFGELMTGIKLSTNNILFERLTDATLAIMMDSGFYQIDYTKAKPLWWGSKETNKGQFIKDFFTGPPQTTFPDNYIIDANRDSKYRSSGFDYSFIGEATINFEIPNPPDVVKNNPDWYNPWNTVFPGYYMTEYQRIVMPREQCKNGTAAINIKDDNATCLSYKIDGATVEFSSDTFGTVKCTKKGEEVKGTDGTVVICPDPIDFAARVPLRHMNKFESNPFEGAEKYFEKKGLEAWVIALIVIACFVVLVIISVSVFCVIRHKKKDKSSEATP